AAPADRGDRTPGGGAATPHAPGRLLDAHRRLPVERPAGAPASGREPVRVDPRDRRRARPGGLLMTPRRSAFALCFFFSACAAPPAPEGFLVVDDGWDRVKAIATDESMFWVRSFDDPHRGSLDFWHATLKSDLVDHRGYVVLDERD